MRIFAAALVLAAQPVAAQVTDAERAGIAAALKRGTLIYAFDRAAWLGTDDMIAKLPDYATKVGGYVADSTADAPRLIFYDRQPVPRALYIARFAKGRLVEGRLLGAGDDATLSPDLLRSIRAKQAADRALVAANVQRCGAKPFNSVVLPAAGPDRPVRVYYLTPQAERDQLPFGGHYVVEVAADGVTTNPRAFTRSCLTLSTKVPAGGKAVGLFVSHLLDSVPTEIHVFSSLAARTPVIVGTMNPSPRRWIVNGGSIAGPAPMNLPKR